MMFGRKYRSCSVDRIMEEIRVKMASRAKHIFFCDDNFTANRPAHQGTVRAHPPGKHQDRMERPGAGGGGPGPGTPGPHGPGGCYVVFVGLESINPATLKAYNKSQDLNAIKECVINFHKFGIKVHGMFVFGSEQDHYQVIRDTVKFSRGIDLDSLQYLILTPVPGTPVYAELEKQNRIICRDWSQYDGHHAVFQPRQFTPYELQTETIRAMKKFYSWPSVLTRILARDWFYVMLRTYGRLLIWQSRWSKNNYIQELKEQFVSRVRRLRGWLPGSAPVTKVGIPADAWKLGPWENAPREFLLRFLQKLGVEVVQESEPASQEQGPVAAVKAEIARLQGKADLVLLPLWDNLESARQRVRDLAEEFSGEGWTKLLPLEFSRDSFYHACIDLGLCFKQRVERIRRIYFQTMAEVGAEI